MMRVRREPYGFLDAVLRNRRAQEHLGDVARMVAEFRGTPRDIGTVVEAESIEELLSRKRYDIRIVPVPVELPIRVGEVAYNLRCSLDYLVFALAWHDSGQEPTGTWARQLQFPVFEEPEMFERRCGKMLKGLSDAHVSMIHEYQPAAGCDWLRFLVSLSDSDKHRHLSLLVASFDFEGDSEGTWVSSRNPRPGAEPNGEGLYAIEDLDMKDEATLDLVFPDGNPVAEGMNDLAEEAWELLLRFGREFKLRPIE